eukprot:144795_1
MSQEKQLEIAVPSEEDRAEHVEAPPSEEDRATISKEEWRILQSTQCPLMPDTYERSNPKLVAPYYYNDEFWIEDEKDDTKARIVEFAAENRNEPSKCDQFFYYVTFTRANTKEMAKKDAKLMLAVDEYVKEVRVNRSYELHTKLHVAMAEKRDGKDDGDDSNDAYKKLVPSWIGRMAFIVGFLTTALNGYFIVHGLNLALNGRYSTWTMNLFALIMSLCELVLYCNILLGNMLTMFFTFLIQSCLGGTSYIQTKVIALNLRDLTTLSILRYMPSVEIVTNFMIHWRQSFAAISTDFHLTIHNSCVDPERRNVCDVFFSVPVFIIETCAPLLSIYALLVKMKALGFVVEGEPFASWTGYGQYIAFFAFLNQVSGLRVLRKIETSSIQHFVFSGADASLDADELLLLDDWWNVTVLSAVSNLKLSWYDNMVFW